jgi:hypothetical protein
VISFGSPIVGPYPSGFRFRIDFKGRTKASAQAGFGKRRLMLAELQFSVSARPAS